MELSRKDSIIQLCMLNQYSLENNRKIIFNNNFNSDLTEFLPIISTVPEIIFGTKFNQSVNNLPEGIKRITFGPKFNKSISQLPSSVEYIKLSSKFNLSLNNLPVNLKYLEIGGAFKKKILNLPEGLLELNLKVIYDSSLPVYYPSSLKKLSFDNMALFLTLNLDVNPFKNLPEGLENLKMSGLIFPHYFQNLPSTITTMRIDFFGEDEILPQLPPNLKILYLMGSFNNQVDNLPNSLEELYFADPKGFSSSEFNCPLDNLPQNLKVLYLNREFNKPLDFLPQSLKKLIFQVISPFNYPLDNLPSGLEELTIGCRFTHDLNNLPDTIKILSICNKHYTGRILKIPDSLVRIRISSYYPHSESFKSRLKFFVNFQYLIDTE